MFHHLTMRASWLAFFRMLWAFSCLFTLSPTPPFLRQYLHAFQNGFPGSQLPPGILSWGFLLILLGTQHFDGLFCKKRRKRQLWTACGKAIPTSLWHSAAAPKSCWEARGVHDECVWGGLPGLPFSFSKKWPRIHQKKQLNFWAACFS